MLDLMRKHHKVAMLVTAIIVIITMAFWGDTAPPGGPGYNREFGGKIYDQTDMAAVETEFMLARSVSGFTDAPGKLMFLLQDPGKTRDNGQVPRDAPLVNLITLRQEAKNLGITASDAEVQKAIQGLPRLQTDGKFDRSKLDALLAKRSDRPFVEMMRDALIVEKLQKLVGGSMPATDYGVNLAYNKEHVKTTVQVAILPRKEHEAIKATDEDAQKFYDANKDKPEAEQDPVLRSEPNRDMKYIKILRAVKTEDISKLKPEEQEAKRKEWSAIDTKAAVTASAINNAMIDQDKPLTIEDAVALVKDKPEYVPVEIKMVEKVTASTPPDDLKSEGDIFGDMFEEEVGVKNTPTSHIIFDTGDLVPSRLLTLEEAKTKLLEKLTKEKITAALLDKATGVRSKIQETLTAAKPFAEALTSVGVTAISYTYSAKAPPKDAPPYFAKIQQAVTGLTPNTLAPNPVEAGDDLAVVFLEKVELPDDPKMPEDKVILKKNAGINDSPFSPSPLFRSWFQQRRDAIAPVFGGAQ